MSVEPRKPQPGAGLTGTLVLSSGAFLLLWSAWLGLRQAELLYDGLRAPGYINKNEPRIGDGRLGSKTRFHAVVSFTDIEGKYHWFTDSLGTAPPLYAEGEKVTVLYLKDDPASAAIDRGVWNWLLPALLAATGALLARAGRRMRRENEGRGTHALIED
jgi:hypothetical protein